MSSEWPTKPKSTCPRLRPPGPSRRAVPTLFSTTSTLSPLTPTDLPYPNPPAEMWRPTATYLLGTTYSRSYRLRSSPSTTSLIPIPVPTMLHSPIRTKSSAPALTIQQESPLLQLIQVRACRTEPGTSLSYRCARL